MISSCVTYFEVGNLNVLDGNVIGEYENSSLFLLLVKQFKNKDYLLKAAVLNSMNITDKAVSKR